MAADEHKPPAASKDDGKPSSKDVGQDEVQAKVDKAEDKGYFGYAPDPYPNEAYSLETDPLSSPGMEDHMTRSEQHPLVIGDDKEKK